MKMVKNEIKRQYCYEKNAKMIKNNFGMDCILKKTSRHRLESGKRNDKLL